MIRASASRSRASAASSALAAEMSRFTPLVLTGRPCASHSIASVRDRIQTQWPCRWRRRISRSTCQMPAAKAWASCSKSAGVSAGCSRSSQRSSDSGFSSASR